MIPKKIHYLWFGGREKPERVQRQIQDWRERLPDYDIIEWNEDNYQIPLEVVYVKQAYEAQQWAFVTDYARLDILNRYGGIYLDTDVEVVKTFDELLGLSSFIGEESYQVLCTAVIGSEPHQAWLDALLQDYQQRTFALRNGTYDKTPNSKYIWQFLAMFNGKKPVELAAPVFSPINYATRQVALSSETITIHHYAGDWKTPTGLLKDKLLVVANRMLGEKRVVMFKQKLKNVRG